MDGAGGSGFEGECMGVEVGWERRGGREGGGEGRTMLRVVWLEVEGGVGK